MALVEWSTVALVAVAGLLLLGLLYMGLAIATYLLAKRQIDQVGREPDRDHGDDFFERRK
jgi:hypothetical protein